MMTRGIARLFSMSFFSTSPECQKLGLRAGAIWLENLCISSRSDQLNAAISDTATELLKCYGALDKVRSSAEVASFRKIHRQVGARPKKQPPSVENLYRYLLKRSDLPPINNLVDAYNLVSLRTRCSLGAHDLDRITLPVSLSLLTGQEAFTPLGTEDPVTVPAGEFGYVDAEDRLLCRLDVVQADFSKVTTDTHRALIIIEATSDHDSSQVQQAFDEVVHWTQLECGASVQAVQKPT
jgi:DNA/RNA-binding domain of Phe-tRNA-synthetase-like protein